MELLTEQEKKSPKIYRLEQNLFSLFKNINCNISAPDSKILMSFYEFLLNFRPNLSPHRRLRYMNCLYIVRIRGFLEQDFLKANPEDIKKYQYNLRNTLSRHKKPYSPESIKLFNISLKYLYAWLEYGETCMQDIKEKGYPDLVKRLQTNIPAKIAREGRIKSADLLNESELCGLWNVIDDPMAKAFWQVLYDGGLRISECGLLKVGDVGESNHGFKIQIRHSKTLPRQILISEYSYSLKKWLEIHPDWNNPDAWLWPTGYDNPVHVSTWGSQIRTYARKAGIKKRVYPHLFRHTRATELLVKKQIPIPLIKQRSGWLQGSTSFEEAYLHLASEDIDKAYLEATNQKPKEKEKPNCKNCGADMNYQLSHYVQELHKKVEDAIKHIAPMSTN